MGIKNTKTYKRGFKDGWEQAKSEAKDAVECADYDADDWSRRNPEHVATAVIAALKYNGLER